ncbi:MAG: hypothetical protein ACYTGH_14840, partial [Planctomycetota bacterium]
MKAQSLILCLLLSVLGFMPALRATEILSNQHVVDMIEAKLDTDLVKKKIQACDNDFDVSASAMVALRKKGVPDAVIKTMLSAAEKQKTRRNNRIKLQIQYLTSERAEARHAA